MAKIYEEIIAVKLSKLVKDGADSETLADDDRCIALEELVQELFGADPSVIVEVAKVE
jgi:hypothetical protein